MVPIPSREQKLCKNIFSNDLTKKKNAIWKFYIWSRAENVPQYVIQVNVKTMKILILQRKYIKIGCGKTNNSICKYN